MIKREDQMVSRDQSVVKVCKSLVLTKITNMMEIASFSKPMARKANMDSIKKGNITDENLCLVKLLSLTHKILKQLVLNNLNDDAIKQIVNTYD